MEAIAPKSFWDT